MCAYILQEYKGRILVNINFYCYENKKIRNNVVLCAYSLMISKENYKPKLLIELKNVVRKKWVSLYFIIDK